MKTLKYLGLFLVLTLTVISCANNEEDPEKEAKLEEAGRLHDEGLSLGEETLAMIEDAGQLIRQIQEAMPGIEDDLREEANAHINSISAVKEDHEAWKNSLVEVPGHAHAHHEGEGHNHDHSMDDASPDEIVEKQEKLKDYIADINNRTLKAIEALQTIVDQL